jgi:hypothetical protein
VVRDTWLPSDVTPGDLLAVAATGAYCRSMASNYNYVPRPPVIAVRDAAASVLVRRETEADLLRLGSGLDPDRFSPPTEYDSRGARARRGSNNSETETR